tara:strand:+ start:1048 stop:1326 length:279 start_codon:yes stop_codon:yes gene_type:complete
MTDIEKTLRRLTRAHQHLTQLEAQLDEYEADLPETHLWQLAEHDNIVRAYDEQENKIDQLCIRLAIQKHGHDWHSIKALAKHIKRHYTRREQ